MIPNEEESDLSHNSNKNCNWKEEEEGRIKNERGKKKERRGRKKKGEGGRKEGGGIFNFNIL